MTEYLQKRNIVTRVLAFLLVLFMVLNTLPGGLSFNISTAKAAVDPVSENQNTDAPAQQGEQGNDQSSEYKLVLQTITDPTRKVSVTGYLPEGAKVTARVLSYDEIQALELIGVEVVFAYDITITVDGVEYQPKSPVSVHIKEDEIPSDLTVSHVETNEDGEVVSVSEVETTVSERGDAVFNADSFSIYIGTVSVSGNIMLTAGAGYEFYSDPSCTTPTSGSVEWTAGTTIYARATLSGVSITDVNVINAASGTASSSATVTSSSGTYTITFAAPTASSESQIVSVSLSGMPVTIDIGFVPSAYTNDSSLQTLEIPGSTGDYMLTRTVCIEASLNDVIDLGTPNRFGYTFQGWTKTAGGSTTTLSGTTDTFTSLDTVYTATWAPNTYSLVISATSLVPIANVQIAFNGTPTLTVPDFYAANPSYFSNLQQSNLYLSVPFTYGETMSSFFARINSSFGLPVLADNRASSVRMSFAGWTVNNVIVSGSSVLSISDGGILVCPDGSNLEAYAESLLTDKTTMMARWEDMSFQVSLTNKPSDWSFSYTVLNQSGQPVTTPLSGNSFMVPRGANVNMQVPASSQNYITGWNFTYVSSGSTVTLYPEELPYSVGDQYINYEFTMPSGDVTGEYTSFNSSSYASNPVYVDLSLGSVNFQKYVTYNNRSVNGFWYSAKMVASTYTATTGNEVIVNKMTPLFGATDINDPSTYQSVDASGNTAYFYPWNTSTAAKFYVTSRGIDIKNQVILSWTTDLYILDAKMVATDSFVSDANGRVLGSTSFSDVSSSLSATGVDLSAYGNIVQNTSENVGFRISIYADGSNCVNAILQSLIRTDSSLYIFGESSSMVMPLGTIIGSFQVYIRKIKLVEINNNFDYFLVTDRYMSFGDEGASKACIISMPNKNLVQAAPGGRQFLISSFVEIEVKNFYHGYIGKVYGYLRIRGNYCFGTYGAGIYGKGSIVIDGDATTTTYTSDWAGSHTLSDGTGTGYFIVKGSCVSANALYMSGGVLISNCVQGPRAFGAYSNSCVITNQILNQMVYGKSDAGGSYSTAYVSSSRTESLQNDDGLIYQKWIGETGTLGGLTLNGYVYLLGDTSALSTKYFDMLTCLMYGDNNYNTSNSVGVILRDLDILDANGDLKQELRHQNADIENAKAVAEAAVRAKVATDPHCECVVYGNSKWYLGNTKYVRTIVNGGHVYAAGNITLFNDLFLQDGSIYCGGVLSTKRNLSVTGGTVEAEEVGIVYNLTTTESNLTNYQIASFENCTVKTGRIGVVSTVINTVRPKGALQIGADVTLIGLKTDPSTSVTYAEAESDLYSNYVVGSTVYHVSASNPGEYDFTGRIDSGSNVTSEGNLQMASAVTLNAPPSSYDEWHFNALEGVTVTTIPVSGVLYGSTNIYSDYISAVFYAVKTSYSIRFLGDYNSGFTATGSFGTVTSNGDYTANTGETIQILFDDATHYHNAVVWYYLTSGEFRSLLVSDANYDSTHLILTFTMPYSDVEVWVTSELSLDINLSNIAFTNDGFAVDLDTLGRPADTVFHYAGDLRIISSVVGSNSYSYNYMVFEENSGNAPYFGCSESELSRVITMQSILLSCLSTDFHRSIISVGGNCIAIKLQGINAFGGICFTQSDDLCIYGDPDDGLDKLNNSIWSETNYLSLVISDGSIGNVRFENIHISSAFKSMSGVVSASTGNTGDVYFINCSFDTDRNMTLARRARNVYIDNCTISFKFASNYEHYLAYISGTVYVQNGSNITVMEGTTESNKTTFINNKIVVDNSNVSLIYYRNNSGESQIVDVYGTSGELTLQNRSVFTAQARFTTGKINITDSTLNVTNADKTENTGYLLCNRITANTGSVINAGYVIVSGFSNVAYNNNNNFNTIVPDLSKFHNGSSFTGLVVNGGTINATEFVGGDYNGVVTLNSGVINTKRLGTYGAVFGYPTYLPKLNSDHFIDVYEKVPVGATVNVNGGTVNVTSGGYIGGMNATVNIAGGIVNLQNGSIMGMTDSQATTLALDYSSHGDNIVNHVATNNVINITDGTVNNTASTGSINAPYGTVSLTGPDAVVRVYDMKAVGGVINVTGASGEHFNNPYPYLTSELHQKVGLVVDHELTAKSINIVDGSVVYAGSAIANVDAGQTGGLVVQQLDSGTTSKAYLYTGGSYGSIGDGTLNNDYNTGALDLSLRNVFGSQIVNVRYHLNPGTDPVLFAIDEEEITFSAPNISYYDVVTDTSAPDNVRYFTLINPTCLGYRFVRWENQYGDTVTRIDKMDRSDQDFYAIWERVVVPFRIYIEISDPTEANPSMTHVSGSKYYFNTVGYAVYGSEILGNGANKINLSLYTTNGDVVSEVMLDDTAFTSINGSSVLIAGDTIVNKKMVQAYMNKGYTELELTTVNAIERNVGFYFHMNLTGGRPVDAHFNNVGNPTITATATQIISYLPIRENLGYVLGGVTNGTDDELMQPTAPGYTFGGWFKDQACTAGNEVTGSVTIASLQAAGTTQFYAKWTPNRYTVRFEIDSGVTEHTWITPKNDGTNATRPGEYDSVSNPGYKTLDYKWTYDTPITSSNYVTSYTYVNANGEQCNGTDEIYDELPTAWREGYVFLGWKYTVDSTDYFLAVDDELNIASFTVDNLALAVPDALAITFTAVFEKATVTYHATKGTLVSLGDGHTYVDSSLAYKAPLAAYHDAPGAGSLSTHKVVADQTDSGAVDYGYGVISTTADYFSTNSNTYYAGDFRETIQRKGYTFVGWNALENGSGDPFYSAPRFEHLEVYDQWDENKYTLRVYGIYDDTPVTAYTSNFSSGATSNVDTVEVSGTPVTTTYGNGAGSVTVPVKVGETIPYTGSIHLPSRSGSWYAINDTSLPDNYKRYLLGVTFAPLDPGLSKVAAADNGGTEVLQNTQYNAYAEAISRMFASGTLLQDGTGTFFLPEDTAYRTDIGDATVVSGAVSSVSVLDYPTDSEIKTYGVYRERSLVLVERYVTDTEHRRIVYAGAWQTWKDVFNGTDKYVDSLGYNTITSQGFVFLGWYVNYQDVHAGNEYPDNQADYTSGLGTDGSGGWKDQASNLGVYDIMVYTVYVPVDNKEITLTASSDPTSTQPSDTYVYTLPNSVQSGYMSFEVYLPSGVHLTTVADMIAHQLDDSWSTFNANNTVAIRMTIHANGDSGNGIPACTRVYDLASYLSGATWFANDSSVEQVIRAGDTVTLELFHSNVMSAEELDQLLKLFTGTSPSYTSHTIELRFDNDNTSHTDVSTLAGQEVNLMINVQLVDSLYSVHYIADLPDDAHLVITDNNLFDVSGDPATRDRTSVKYREIKNQPAPVIEGYSVNTVTPVASYPVITGDPSIWNVTSDPSAGAITVQASYSANTYELVADSDTLARWGVTYTDCTSASLASGSPLDSAGTAENVKYHSTVTITPSGTQHPEFITVTVAGVGSYRLDDTSGFITYDSFNNEYTFLMPAHNVSITYNDVATLYLDDGSISITDTQYTQNGTTITWPGSYVIKQNAENDSSVEDVDHNAGWVNTLSFSGDMSGRDITLGNIKINSAESITLSNTANIPLNIGSGDTLAGSITAKSIRVPSGATINLTSAMTSSGSPVNAAVTLNPTSGAAIGGTSAAPANGTIILSNLDLTMALKSSETASGVGMGAYSTTDSGSPVTVSNCNVTVSETGAGSWNGGAWIGGNNVSTVTVTDTVIERSTSQSDATFGLKVVDGNTVTLNTVTVGSNSRRVYDPVHANSALNIVNSEIYLENKYGLGANAMIGTNSGVGTTTVTNSDIDVSYSGGSSDDLYTGVLKIVDKESDVVIDDTQILEVSNADITITAATVNQGGTVHNHTGDYMLIDEFNLTDRPGKTVNDLTVNSIGSGKKIIVSDPDASNTAVVLDTATFNTDTSVDLEGNLTINGVTAIGSHTLTVDGNTFSLALEGGFDADNTGNFEMTGGSLKRTTNGDIAVGGNMTLTNVIANADSGKIGSTGAASTATTVSITDSSITATEIGALGNQLFYTDDAGATKSGTFTKVTKDGVNTLTGTLVQDLYRLTYNYGSLTVSLAGLPAAVRMKTVSGTDSYFAVDLTNSSTGYTSGLIPADPGHSASVPFTCWYINTASGRRGLAPDDAAYGLPGYEKLTESTVAADQTTNSDGTRTIPLYAWSYTGTAYITDDRLFRPFAETAITVTIKSNFAWTAKLTVEGSLGVGRDYQVSFGTTLPAGTDLTLIKVGGTVSDPTYTYYYYTLPAASNTVSFSSFKQMGTSTAITFGTTATDETYLLSADFGETSLAASSSAISIGFAIVPDGGSAVNLAAVSFEDTAVTVGVITAASSQVTVNTSPVDDDKLLGKKVYLIGTLDNIAAYEATATLTTSSLPSRTITGTWIASDDSNPSSPYSRIAFELGDYPDIAGSLNDTYSVSFLGLNAGNYNITWGLYAGDSSTPMNCMRSLISNTGNFSITVTAPTLPSLAVTSPAEHVYAQGSAQTLSFTFTDKTAIDSVQVKIEKQTALASFTDVTSSVTVTLTGTNSAVVTLPADLAAGTYRVRFSINGTDSKNDDVYFAFIVE